MNVQLHKKARTTPEIRREIQATDPSISNNALARRYGVHRHRNMSTSNGQLLYK